MQSSNHGGGIADILLSAGTADAVAIIDGNRRYTYTELRSAAARIACKLASLGLAPEARIGILGANSFFWVAAYLAALKVGVAVPLAPTTAPDDLAAQVRWVDCSAVLVDRRQERRVGSAFGNRPVVTDAVLSSDGESFWPASAINPDDDAALMFTSGTTAAPKAVRTTQQNLISNTEAILSYLDLTSADRMLVILPFSYVFGASLLHSHLAVGASLVLCNTFTFPETAVDLIDKERCTGFAGVPSSFGLLLRTSSYASRPLPSLRLVQQAGGKLSPALIEELVAAQPHSRLFVMYGQTEATARLSYLPPERLKDKLGSIGRGIPSYVQLRVVDDAGLPVGPGGTGEIIASGPGISPGYLNDPEATAPKFPGGELRTGDVASVDEDGFVYIVGRRDDFIKTWGYRVSGQQVESAAMQLRDVSGAAAVGLPDVEAGEAITLAITLSPGSALTVPEVEAFLRDRLPKHAVPQAVHVLTELPLNPAGKVAKPALRDLLTTLSG